jgi:hypothetical protein
MNSRENNAHGNKSKSVANTICPTQGSDDAAARFVDNRQEKITQRALQKKIMSSPQVKQLKAMQQMPNNSPLGLQK